MCNILYLSPSTFITENNPNSFPIMKLLDNVTVFGCDMHNIGTHTI